MAKSCLDSPHKKRAGRIARSLEIPVLLASVCFFEFADDQLALHAQHGGADPLRFRRIRIAHHDIQAFRHDLPSQAIPILEPAARQHLAALGQRIPETVDLFLRPAVHRDGDRLAEFVHRTAVDRGKMLAMQLEVDGRNIPRLLAGHLCHGLCEIRDVRDSGIIKQRHVKIHRFLRLVVKPEISDDFPHANRSLIGMIIAGQSLEVFFSLTDLNMPESP